MGVQLMVRYSGEISTKARGTRMRFLRQLARNVEDALRSAGVDYELRREWSRLFVDLRGESPQAPEVLARVFGVQSLSIVEPRPGETLEQVVREGEKLFRERVRDKSFAVRARVRRDRAVRIPFGATTVERELGAALLPHARRVDLTRPEVTVYVEVRDGTAYFFTEQLPGPGGLPLGVEGRAVSLVSGGFDSAVASWRMLRRGVSLEYVFCNLGGEIHRRDVLRVLKILSDQWSYGTRPKLHAVDFSPIVKELQAKTEARYWQVLLKRLMLRVGERVAREIRAQGIVTGESVGQVSSQTMQNLYVISEAVSLPIYRPLAGFTKEEIVAEARRIGTYDLSASVAEYCALVPRRPATKASLRAVREEEAKLDPSRLEEALEGREVFDLRAVDPATLSAPDIEIEEIPEGAVVIDLRSPGAYRAWHYPGAVHLDFFQALEEYKRFPKDRTYVLYCELGLKSAHLAELMRKEGFRAYNFRGGLKKLLEYALEREALPPELVPPEYLFGRGAE